MAAGIRILLAVRQPFVAIICQALRLRRHERPSSCGFAMKRARSTDLMIVQAARIPGETDFKNGSAQVCVARHGETDWNIAVIPQEWIDATTRDEGRRQTMRWLPDWPLQA